MQSQMSSSDDESDHSSSSYSDMAPLKGKRQFKSYGGGKKSTTTTNAMGQNDWEVFPPAQNDPFTYLYSK